MNRTESENRKLILGIETCTPAGGVAIADCEGRLLAHRWTIAKTGYSRRLMPMIDGAIADCGAKKGDIAGICVSQGPGSFTGVRVGVVTAKTLAFALGVPLYLVSSLGSLARRWPIAGEIVVPVLDARRKEIYGAIYRHGENAEIELLRDERVEPVERLLADAKSIGEERLWFLGDGALAKRAEIEQALGERAQFVPQPWGLPAADVVALQGADLLAAGEAGVDPMTAVPVYLRSSDAERSLAHRPL